MKLFSRLRHVVALLSLTLGAFALSSQSTLAADEEYSFKVHNKTEQKIKQVLVSEDKRLGAISTSARELPQAKR
jgi:hypothetical protein